MSNTKSSHIHKLKRHTYATGSKVYFCVAADCNYKVGVELSLGKRSICWRCGNEFSLNEYTMRLAKPHCDDCHKRRVTTNVTVPDRHHTVSDTSMSLRERLAKVSTIKSDDVDL